MGNYRVLVGHNSVRVLFDCPQCGGVAAVRDHVTAAASGRSWIDCAGGCLNQYSDVDQAFCRAAADKHGTERAPATTSRQESQDDPTEREAFGGGGRHGW